jgi:hypothetical protein
MQITREIDSDADLPKNLSIIDAPSPTRRKRCLRNSNYETSSLNCLRGKYTRALWERILRRSTLTSEYG